MSREFEMPFSQLVDESIEKIDELIKAKILDGFTFDGLKFSMSIEAQINWSNIVSIPDAYFPIQINSKENDVYLLELSKKNLFYSKALNHKMNLLQLAGTIKNNIKNSTNVEDVTSLVASLVSNIDNI